MQKQKQIKKLRPLIQRSVFLDIEAKQRLLDNLERVSDHDLMVLSALFGDAQKRQDELVDRVVQYDGSFVRRLRQFMKDQVLKARGAFEKKHRKKEKPEEILKEME